jgi:hypothetical protein
MIAQRIRHSSEVPIDDAQGNSVVHTREFVSQLFDEELDRLLAEVPAESPASDAPASDSASNERSDPAVLLREARRLSEEMISRGEFTPA